MEIQKCYGRTDGVKCFRRGSILRTFSLLLKRASGICQVVPDTETVNFSLATQWVSSVSDTQNCDRQCIGQQWWSHLSGGSRWWWRREWWWWSVWGQLVAFSYFNFFGDHLNFTAQIDQYSAASQGGDLYLPFLRWLCVMDMDTEHWTGTLDIGHWTLDMGHGHI